MKTFWLIVLNLALIVITGGFWLAVLVVWALIAVIRK